MANHASAAADEVRLHLLVLRCQAGDERAFRQLIDEFGARSLSYLRGLLGDEAEDVQQEVWLGVYSSLHTLANPRAFRTWLFRMTRHRAVDHLRRRRRERELLEDVALATDVEAAADESALGPVDAAALDAAMAQIPPPQREVLLLRHRDDLSYAEIAQIVGSPVGTVKTRLHHGRKRLQELLQRGVP